MSEEATATVELIVKAINSSDCISLYHLDDIPGMDKAKKVAQIDLDEHRWYMTATDVYDLDGRFVGVSGVSMLKSETMGFDDVGLNCKAFEMVAVPSVKYVAK